MNSFAPEIILGIHCLNLESQTLKRFIDLGVYVDFIFVYLSLPLIGYILN